MLKSEFESLAGRAVTNEQYRAIEILYMSSNLEKAEFVQNKYIIHTKPISNNKK